ncbi:KpsF/GutQ family sugar-phosphate isomerase [Legionella sp. W05-934-2]|uniref:KpsF/GutQ family sugar-phosphate isomerase n=1 Tax=Legionella sp. W05-934-2 TaxID=1198649 RepID=UPI003461A25B
MDYCQLGLAVVENEASAIFELQNRIDAKFSEACSTMIACEGRIIVMGMGKSGHIGGKIAATLSSTGTPAFFVHPGEASHGDLGMITRKDIVLAISYSGNTPEIVILLPILQRLQVPLIALTGNPDSTLAKAAKIHLDVSVKQEACPLGLAPTTSTTASLVMGDALAIALLDARGFTADDFALSHPGGQLGKRLLLKVDDICHAGELMPCVNEKTLIADALIEVSEKKLGMTCVVNQHGILSGIFTDGDVRRCLNRHVDIHKTAIAEVMSLNPLVISQGTLAIDALNKMQAHSVTALIIINEQKKPMAVVHLHDLLKAGVI